MDHIGYTISKHSELFWNHRIQLKSNNQSKIIKNLEPLILKIKKTISKKDILSIISCSIFFYHVTLKIESINIKTILFLFLRRKNIPFNGQ